MTSDYQRSIRAALELVEEGDFISLVVLSMFFYYGLGYVTNGILTIQRVAYGYNSKIDGEPKVIASAVATIYLFAHFIWLAGDFDHDPEVFVFNGLRCFFAARILYAVCVIQTTLMLVMHEPIKAARKKTAVGSAIASVFVRLKSLLLPPSAPAPEPEVHTPSQQEIYQQEMDEAQSEYQQRCTMLDNSGLDAMEKTAVRLRLKQQYLKKMRDIIQD